MRSTQNSGDGCDNLTRRLKEWGVIQSRGETLADSINHFSCLYCAVSQFKSESLLTQNSEGM
jgi:hypothetical protein